MQNLKVFRSSSICLVFLCSVLLTQGYGQSDSIQVKDTSPILDEAKAIFSNVTCVEDGQEFVA